MYRGEEIERCTILESKLGWVGTQMCKYADVKASVRLGVGVTASAAVERGKPTGRCEACCANGTSVGCFEAGPQGLLEGKAAASFKRWKLAIEAGIGVKACGSLTGQGRLRLRRQPVRRAGHARLRVRVCPSGRRNPE